MAKLPKPATPANDPFPLFEPPHPGVAQDTDFARLAWLADDLGALSPKKRAKRFAVLRDRAQRMIHFAGTKVDGVYVLEAEAVRVALKRGARNAIAEADFLEKLLAWEDRQ